jgi:hypothetical protein
MPGAPPILAEVFRGFPHSFSKIPEYSNWVTAAFFRVLYRLLFTRRLSNQLYIVWGTESDSKWNIINMRSSRTFLLTVSLWTSVCIRTGWYEHLRTCLWESNLQTWTVLWLQFWWTYRTCYCVRVRVYPYTQRLLKLELYRVLYKLLTAEFYCVYVY